MLIAIKSLSLCYIPCGFGQILSPKGSFRVPFTLLGSGLQSLQPLLLLHEPFRFVRCEEGAAEGVLGGVVEGHIGGLGRHTELVFVFYSVPVAMPVQRGRQFLWKLWS